VQDWPSVFSGSAESARDLASELEARGLRSFVDDRQGPVVSPHGGRASFSVVLVSPEDAERALLVAREWHSQNRQDAHQLTGRLARVLGASLVLPAAWGLGHLLAPQLLPAPEFHWLVGIWLVSLLAVAQIENRRHTRERITTSAPR
jgi:hypothetical protein